MVAAGRSVDVDFCELAEIVAEDVDVVVDQATCKDDEGVSVAVIDAVRFFGVCEAELVMIVAMVLLVLLGLVNDIVIAGIDAVVVEFPAN